MTNKYRKAKNYILILWASNIFINEKYWKNEYRRHFATLTSLRHVSSPERHFATRTRPFSPWTCVTSSKSVTAPKRMEYEKAKFLINAIVGDPEYQEKVTFLRGNDFLSKWHIFGGCKLVALVTKLRVEVKYISLLHPRGLSNFVVQKLVMLTIIQINYMYIKS